MIRATSGFVALLLMSQAGQTPRFRATATTVVVDVAVQLGGTPVSDLSTSDFELRDNAVLQRIEAISIVAVPIDVTLVVDVSNSTSGQIASYQRDVSAIAASLRSMDRLRVLSFESVVREVVPLTPADGAVAVARLETGRLSSVYDGVAAALLRQSEAGRRHLIIAYTDGGENRSILTGNQLLNLAKTADAVLNVVTPRPLPEIVELDSKPCDPGGLLKTDTVYDPVRGRMVDAWESEFRGEKPGKLEPCVKRVWLDEAARITGGHTHTGSALAGMFATIFKDFLNSYVLYFQPAGVSSSGWHDVKVKVTRPGQYTVSARRGYFAEPR